MSLRKLAIKNLSKNLDCSKDIAENILRGMDREAKEQTDLCNECACEMA